MSPITFIEKKTASSRVRMEGGRDEEEVSYQKMLDLGLTSSLWNDMD